MVSILFVGTLMLSSCGGSGDKDDTPDDSAAPTISTSVPTANQSFSLGGSFQYTGTFTDDVELKNVTFSIEKIDAPSTLGIDDPSWAPDDVTITLSGTTETVDAAIFDIPSGVNDGVYQLTILCSDAVSKTATEEITINLGSTNY